MHWLTLWHRFLQDFYPLDNSRVAPNITASLVQYVLIFVGMYAFWKPLRKWIDRGVAATVHKHVSPHFSALHDKLDAAHEKLDGLVADKPDA